MMTMLFIIYPIFQLGNFLSWNQVKGLLDTNNITRINIIESDLQASLNMNYSHIIQNQNRHLFDDILNFSRAQCNETIVYSNKLYQTKFSRQKNEPSVDIRPKMGFSAKDFLRSGRRFYTLAKILHLHSKSVHFGKSKSGRCNTTLRKKHWSERRSNTLFRCYFHLDQKKLLSKT